MANNLLRPNKLQLNNNLDAKILKKRKSDALNNNVEECSLNNENNSENEEQDENIVNTKVKTVTPKSQKTATNKQKKNSVNKEVTSTINLINNLSLEAKNTLNYINSIKYIFSQEDGLINKINDYELKNKEIVSKLKAIIEHNDTIKLFQDLSLEDLYNNENLLTILKYIIVRLPFTYPSSKMCEKCKTLLPITLFKKFNTTKDGLKKTCLKCDESNKPVKNTNYKKFIKDDDSIITPNNLTIQNAEELLTTTKQRKLNNTVSNTSLKPKSAAKKLSQKQFENEVEEDENEINQTPTTSKSIKSTSKPLSTKQVKSSSTNKNQFKVEEDDLENEDSNLNEENEDYEENDYDNE